MLENLSALLEGQPLPLSTTGRAAIISGKVNFVAAHGAVIGVLSHDPSVKRQAAAMTT